MKDSTTVSKTFITFFTLKDVMLPKKLLMEESSSLKVRKVSMFQKSPHFFGQLIVIKGSLALLFFFFF